MGREQENQRLHELGDFLCTRRARFAPEDEGLKTLNHPQVGYLMFEHLTFQMVDTPDFNVNVYSPLDQAETPAKLSHLLSERLSVSRGF